MRNTETCPGKILFAVFALLAALSPDGLLAGVGEWTSSGPEGAVVTALAAHPSNPSTVYVATFRRVYRSVDGGDSWAPTELSGHFVDLLLPTSAPSVAYAIMTNPYGFGAEFHRTGDGGESWVDRATPPGRLVSMAVDPNDPMALYAVTASGLFRTTNGGDVWEPLATPSTGGFGLAGIAVDPADSRVLYAALTGGDFPGVHRSPDRGATWNRTGLRDPTRELLFDPTDTSRLFAITGAGLQVTSNRGESWRKLGGQPDLSHLAIDLTDPNRLYVLSGGGVVLRSSDGGETMTRISSGTFGGNVVAITASGPGTILAGSERGIYRSQDAGQAWGAANLGIREVFAHSIAVDPTDPAVVFAAGPRGIYESRDGGESWIEPVAQSPDAQAVVIDPSDRSTLYAAGSGVHKSTDRGQTWQETGLVDYIAELVIDPNDSRRLFAAYGSVYRSLDGAEGWKNVMTPDDNYSSYYYPPTVTAMDLAPSDGATVYAGGADGGGFLYRSDDGGDNWFDLTSVDFGINALAVDSCDPRILHAGAYGAVYRTIDGGNSWRASTLLAPVPVPLPNPVFALARDPRHSSSVFAGTSSGLFWTNDRGASWTRFDPPLTEPIRSLALDPSGRFLYAGTERGVFQLERNFEPCREGPDRLCLIGAKYQVSVTARARGTGAPITGRAIVEGDQFGYFSFPDVTGDPSFPEVFVKMVDATGAPPPYGGHAWVFHSSLTDLDYTLTVLETETGRIRTYDAADSRPLTCGRADTSAFERDCAAEVAASRMPGARLAPGSGTDLSLLSGRFRATLQARDPRTSRIAVGAAMARGEGFGYFSLPDFTGDPSFPEVFVKMVDATPQTGGYFGVFHTGLTDLEYTLTVTDTVTGAVRTYTGGATDGTRLCGQVDTTAFRN
jgi:photosystem II stability/assembly factor-like uncharacterized protein